MNADSLKQPLQADEPKVLVLGDSIVDLLVYDMRAEDADKSLAWTSPLSPDDWHYAAGFKTRQCVAGASAIHAMLWANDIAVAGNAYPNDGESRKPHESGSIFVLRKRANDGNDKEERTRAYLMYQPEKPCQKNAASGSDTGGPTAADHQSEGAETNDREAGGKDGGEKYPKVSIDREETWRAAVSLLSKKEVTYVKQPFEGANHNYETGGLRAVCLWDDKRGFFQKKERQKEEEIEEPEEAWQERVLEWYRKLRTGNRNPPIVIRTSDPSRFKHFLTNLANEQCSPHVVLVCALAQLRNGDLKGSGTWSGVWREVYDYLNSDQNTYLVDSTKNTWRFHVVVPVYQDGVIWIGPDCWPIEVEDRKNEFLHGDKRPLGKLFAVPGAQPGLSEFEEHSGMVGVHTLLTYAILEQLAEESGMNLSPAIKKGLMRARRLRSHGYCAPEELTSMKEAGKPYYISYHWEVWKKGQRDVTDRLLEVEDKQKVMGQLTGQCAGPYEVECKVDFPNPTVDFPTTEVARRSSASLRIFETMEKKISKEFVASPKNCFFVAGDVNQEKNPDLINDHWITIKDNPCPLDSFAKEEIKSFRLRQRISMQFGKFAMADPKEAAPILDLAQRVRQHVLSNRYNSPEKGSVFNFALFGSPGSGKSFLAREIARSIDPKGVIFSQKEYNLSQFTDPAPLADAFAAIASDSVGGKVPLVLWDEFDSVVDRQRGGWLARFLMPMQDAHFFDGREKRPIGTAVFVFIGGTFPTAEKFRDWACGTGEEQRKRPPESVLLKAVDFHSRLYTALNMPSIVDEDEFEIGGSKRRGQIFKTSWVNSYAKLARAVLLREFFCKNSKIGKRAFLLSVDEDLCRFLLAIPLRHGARSLERIVEACLVTKPRHVRMLHLPPQHFLAEHIETQNIWRKGYEKPGMTIDDMLEACRQASTATP